MLRRELPKYVKTHSFCCESLGLRYNEANATRIRSATFHRRLCLALVSDDLKRISSNNDGPAAVKSFYHKYNDHGATYFFNATKPDAGLPVYPDRTSMAYYLTRGSFTMKLSQPAHAKRLK